MADTVNEIAKWLDESVPDQHRDTDAVSGEEVDKAETAKEGDASPTEEFDHSSARQSHESTTSQPEADRTSAGDASPAHNHTVLLDDVLDGEHVLGQSRSFVGPQAETEEVLAAPAEEGSITEYNSAVNYISDLIEQLRVPDAAKPAVPSQDREDHAFPAEQTCVLGHEDLDLLGVGSTIPVDPRLVAGIKSPRVDELPQPVDDTESEQGYAYRRSLLHSLREAAHLATNTSLELNDCSRYAHRAYYAGFFGCASAFFSIVFVLMSPKAGTFGFAASVGAFAVAFCLSLVYGISYRAFLRKAVRVRDTRAGNTGADLSTS